MNISPWVVVAVFGAIFVTSATQLFAVVLPKMRASALPLQTGRQRAVVVLSTFVIFGFFALAGLSSSAGEMGRGMTFFSFAVPFPLSTALCWPMQGPPKASST